MNDHSIRCPYCQTEMPWGTRYCPGCSAILEYGAPDAAYAAVVLVSIAAGAVTAHALSSTLGWIGMPVAIIGAVGTTLGVRRHYRDSVGFRLPPMGPS